MKETTFVYQTKVVSFNDIRSLRSRMIYLTGMISATRMIYASRILTGSPEIELAEVFGVSGTDIITSKASNKVLPGGQVLISYCDEGAIYHAVRKHGISYGVAVYH